MSGLVFRSHSRSDTMKRIVATAMFVMATAASAQTPARDPSDKLREVLPADVADRVLKTMADAKRALGEGGEAEPSDDEVEAGADALGKGVDPKAVTELAKTAPKDRDISVAMLVMSQLMDRGLPSDEALAAVEARL